MTAHRRFILVTRLLFLALLGVTTLLTLSCAGRSPVGVPGGTASVSSDPTQFQLLSCTPLALDSQSQDIGPLGGTIQVGPHTFTVPAGALDSTVTITAVTGGEPANRIRFAPDGLTFNQPASLTMSWANCGPTALPTPKVIARVSDALALLEILKSVSNPPSQSVTAGVPHFSDYAVAW